MRALLFRPLLIAAGLAALLSLTGCATVQPWQRGRLANPAMTFDAGASQVGYMTHWQEAREGASGGFGVLSGGGGGKKRPPFFCFGSPPWSGPPGVSGS